MIALPYILITLRFAVPISPGQDHAFMQAQQLAAQCGAEIHKKGTEPPPKQAFAITFDDDGCFLAYNMADPDTPLFKTAQSERKALGFARKLLPGLLLTFDNVASVEQALYASDETQPALAIVDTIQVGAHMYGDVFGGFQNHADHVQTYQDMLERLTQLKDSAPEF